MALTDTNVRNAKPTKKVQKLSDGGGLYLHIAPTGGKYWRMAYRYLGKQKLLSFGSYPAVSLKDARRYREEAKETLAQGIDPAEQKQQQKLAAVKAQQQAENTFEAVAREWFTTYSPVLTEKHATKLLRYLENTLFPVFGNKGVANLEPSDILEAIKPAEAKGTIDTAHRLARLSSQVLTYAQITGKTRYNAAAGLSRAITPNKTTNYPAITEPNAIGLLLRDIDNYDGYPSIVFFLKILPHVFTRPTELRLAEWQEFDLAQAYWKIPVQRMKMCREHTVPLAKQVITLLNELKQFSGTSRYLFPSVRAKSATLSDAGPLAALRRIGYTKEQMCLHGFRAMASTRLNELGYRPDVIEAQLAHKDTDHIRHTYNRAEYMKERCTMMQDWADYLDQLKNLGR